MEKHGLPAVYNALMSGFGEEIGSGDIRFIQDIGQKLEGTPYLDKNTNKLYLCVATTNSTNNDSSFMRFDMKEAFAKLNNLTSRKVIFNGIYDLSIATFIFEKDFNYSFIEISVFYSLDFANEINTIRMPMENNHQALPIFFSGGLASICRVTGNQIYTWDLKNAYLKSVIFVNV